MSKREDMWARVHELSCTHQHIRADECLICRQDFEQIIERACEPEAGIAQGPADAAGEEDAG